MITSRENAQISAARRLRERKGREQAGELLIEGARLIEDAWRAGVRPRVVFIQQQSHPARPLIHGLLTEMAAAGVTIEEVTERVFAMLVDTVTPQGIVAVVAISMLPLPAGATLLLALDGVRDPGNAGTLLRSAEAVGAAGVLFGPGSVDPWNAKVVRAAMGAHFRLPIIEVSDWHSAQTLAGASRWYVAAGEAVLAYDAVDWCEPAVLVVGAEATGAGEDIRALATAVRIPMLGKTESLNAAVAGSVILFEAARQRRIRSFGADMLLR